MGAEWYSPDEGGPVAGLHPIFVKGNAPKLHGMLKVFSHNDPMGPVFVDEPWHSNDSDRELHPATPSETSPSDRINMGNLPGIYPILQGSAHGDGSRDLSVAEFFDHAEILSGQNIGEISPPSSHIGDPPTIVDGGWLDEVLGAFHDTVHADTAVKELSDLGWFEKESTFWTTVWFGKAGTGPNGTDPIQYEARCRCKEMGPWLTERWGPALDFLSKAALHYGAIIQGARYDLNNLMGACVAQCEKFAQAVAEDADSTGVSETMSWRGVSGLFDIATSGINAPFKVVEHVEALLDHDKARRELGQGGYYGTLYNFLTRANALMEETKGAVENLVRKMDEGFDLGGKLHVPTWEGDYEKLEE